MANLFQVLLNGAARLVEGIQQGTGTVDAGKVAMTRADGLLDETIAAPHGLSRVAPGKSVVVPENHVLFFSAGLGLDVEGNIEVDGDIEEIA